MLKFASALEDFGKFIISNAGKIIGTLVGDVHNFTSENAFSAYERIYPSMLYTGTELEHIKTINETTIKALGLMTGWAHGEYIVSKTGEIYLLEVGARGGGNYIGSDILKEMLGMGTHEMAFYTAIGNDAFYEEISLKDSTCAYKCFYLPEGEILSVDIDKSFLEQECIIKHNLEYINNIKYTSKNTDKTSRFTIVVKSENQLELKKLLAEIPTHINIKVKTDNGIKDIIWE